MRTLFMLLLGLSLVLAGCSSESGQNEFTGNVVVEEHTVEEDVADDCSLLEDLYREWMCYRKQAKAQEDPAFCERIGGDEAMYGISSSTARDGCYEGVAMETRNPAYCDLVADSTIKRSCRQYAG